MLDAQPRWTPSRRFAASLAHAINGPSGPRLLAVDVPWQSKNRVYHVVGMRVVDLTHKLGEFSAQA